MGEVRRIKKRKKEKGRKKVVSGQLCWSSSGENQWKKVERFLMSDMLMNKKSDTMKNGSIMTFK